MSFLILGLILFSCQLDKGSVSTEYHFHNRESKNENNQFDFLFEQVSKLQKENRIVGAEVLIIRKDTIQLHEVVGWSNVKKQVELKKNSLYRVRSMTKPLIATAILMLLEDGKLALNDPISKYIPSFKNPNAQDITIKQCLTHTSGLASHDYEEIGLSKRPYQFSTLREVVYEIGEIGVVHEPGKFRYSGSGIAILTELINILSGTSAEDFLKQRIFTPLEMANSYTSINSTKKWVSKLNPTYEWNDSTNNFTQYWNPTIAPEYKYFRGHGGIYTSAMDYAKFISMWLNKGMFNNKRILSNKTIELALSESVSHSSKSPRSHQSLAWMMLKPDSTSNKIGYFMHGGSDGTMAFGYPNEKTIALYFTQSRNHPRFIFENLMAVTTPYNKYRKQTFNNEYLDQWKELLVQSKGSKKKELKEKFGMYVGAYKCKTNNAFDSEIFFNDGKLKMKNIKSGYECELIFQRDDDFICRFRPPPDGFISKVKFNFNENLTKSFTLEWLNKTTFKFEAIK